MEFMSKLQEICDHDLWGFPNYTSIRDGPGRFKASVLVCGKTFHAPDFFKSSQEAQNEAAKLAYHHFSTAASKKPLNRPAKFRRIDSPSPPMSNSSPAAEPAILQHKNQLQIYAQKRKLNLPTYSYVREGPPHNVRCKAMVTVDGQTFESPEFYRTQKEAEHAASRVALESLMSAGILEARNFNSLLIQFSAYMDESAGFSKNFLQEFLMKEGLPLPIYKTKSCGAPHLPTFLTKKQAEMNAHKLHIVNLKNVSKLSATMISGGKGVLQCTSSNSSLNLDLQLNVKSEDRLATPPAQESKKEWKDMGQFRSPPSVASSFKPGCSFNYEEQGTWSDRCTSPSSITFFAFLSRCLCELFALSGSPRSVCKTSPGSHGQLTPYKRRFEAREQVNNNRFKSKGGI
ncbi:hypothetical protein MKW92_000977 [Papaver armeniacum]|nr:hypothetical protein MKW92_000977 [Papaver armeniacum]